MDNREDREEKAQKKLSDVSAILWFIFVNANNGARGERATSHK